MRRLYQRWESPKSLFGDIAILAFVATQCLDGVFTYLGISIWGLRAEGNPLISSAVSVAGLGPALAGAKLFAVALGMALHLFRVHYVVALLTVVYVAGAIIPWAAMFLLQ